MPTVSRARAVAYVVVLLGLLVLGGRLVLDGDEGAAVKAKPSEAVVETKGPPARALFVHVVGAVLRPGLYRLRDGSRVDDAIRRAGGAKPRAQLSLVNLAAPVADGQQVVVPARGTSSAPVAAGSGVSPAPGGPGAGGTVHLNSATLEDLETLPGIGPVLAQQILDHRTSIGAFASVDELDAVPGIGPARLEQLKPLVDL